MGANIAITGSSGYLGTAMLRRFANECDGIYKIVGIDINDPKPETKELYDSQGSRFEFQKMDVRDEKLHELLKEYGIDTIIHLAWVMGPHRDKEEEHDIDFNGTVNVLNACDYPEIKNFIYASSSKIYSDQKEPPWNEDDPLEDSFEKDGYSYGKNKVAVDHMVYAWSTPPKGTRVVVFRPGHFWGPNVDNHLSARFDRDPFIFRVNGYDPERTLIHEDDLARIFHEAIISDDISGVFNLSGGTMKHSAMADRASKELEKPVLDFELETMNHLVEYGWENNIINMSPAYIYTATRDIMLDTEKADSVFGRPEHSAENTFGAFIESAKQRQVQQSLF